jgi:CheY-like chemotaxis protein
MTQAPRRSILIADDEAAILSSLGEILEDAGYRVLAACDGRQALEILERMPVDAILSDISMPHMDGLQLLHIASERWPAVPRILLTGNLLEDYIGRFLQERVSCVLAKNVPFPVREILGSLEALLNPAFSWTEQFFPSPKDRSCVLLHSPREIDNALDDISARLPVARKKPLQLVLQELLTNAMFYGARGEDGANKEAWVHDFTLDPAQAIEFEWLEDDAKIGICVRDRGGKLDGDTVLHWLDRQTRKDPSGIPVGALDEHGRGLFFSRFFSDRLVVNIRKGSLTEVLTLNWLQEPPAGQKPLLIFQT